MRKRTKAVVVAAVVMLGLATAGASWAWLTSTTNANASGGAGGNLTALEQGNTTYNYGTGVTKLYPGHSAGVRIEVKNNNEVPVEIVSVVAGAITATPSGCSAQMETSTSGINIEGAGTNFLIQPGETKALVLPTGVTLKNTADNSCAGVAFSTAWTINIENR